MDYSDHGQPGAGRLSRRAFLERSSWLAGGALVTGTTLGSLAAHRAWAAEGGKKKSAKASGGRAGSYGALRAQRDQDGKALLALPAGFSYVTLSKTGDSLGEQGQVPAKHDGMSAFAGPGGTIRLIRNHELRSNAGDTNLAVAVPAELRYDAKGPGGCFTLDFDPAAKRLTRQFASIGGTFVNCAGGRAWRDAGWITCEETISGLREGFEKPHGYCFLVPAAASAPVAAVPLVAMGRFQHEAAVADERGLVYETEDSGSNSSGFYRFTPERPEDLSRGKLQMLGVRGMPKAELFAGQRMGQSLPAAWFDIADPDPDLEAGKPSCFAQGVEAGAAIFNRLEGIFRGADRSIYFVSTSGGDRKYGQIWQYKPGETPERDALRLVFESPQGSVLDSPDNMCVSPNGTLLLCEDDASKDGDTHPLAPGIRDANRLIAIAPSGEPFEFAVNIASDSEFAGCCFSPDGQFLFVNLQGENSPGTGMTCAIWGPWASGPL